MKATAFFILLAASTAFGQIDSSGLRAKFGAPLHRETFTVRPGIQMIVDYSPTATHACRLEFPGAGMPKDAAPGVGIDVKKFIDDIVWEVVPASVRGKDTGRKFCSQMGLSGMCFTEYDHVTISELSRGTERTAVIVKFKTADCEKLDADLAAPRLL